MEYSIQELARLSGVTSRTLRWYDKIGLLKPSRIAESGYRYYGEAEVNRLQDILYYRSLGVELSQIRTFLDAPDFDRMTTLRKHLSALESERVRLEKLIQSVRDTIGAEERNETMTDEKKFEAFKRELVEENEKNYGKEAREKYGAAEVDAANRNMMGLSQEQYAVWTDLGSTIQSKLEAAVRDELEPDGTAGREVAELHKRWLMATMKTYDAKRHQGIAELYVADERFTAYYDKAVSGCARFLRNAVRYWAEKL